MNGAAASVARACLVLLLALQGEGQPDKYENGARWKNSMTNMRHKDSWFSRWNTMMQPRLDRLVAIAEAEGGEGTTEPFRVAMVGDSTMMHQHGGICAFLAERPGRRFDPAENQVECCVDTLDREIDGGEGGGGRGLCFRHGWQRYADPPALEDLGYPDAVYFGFGLHFLHMCRAGRPLERIRVQAWLAYERDLERVVRNFREEGRDNIRLVFMTCHSIENSVYNGGFLEVVNAYRTNNASITSLCDSQVAYAANGETGPDGYGQEEFCRNAVLDRNGSDSLNRRSRAVMARLGVPLVEADLITKDQAWATPSGDGRHYQFLVPTELWELLGVLTSPFSFNLPNATSLL